MATTARGPKTWRSAALCAARASTSSGYTMAPASAHLVRGLAETLETTTDFLLGLSDEQDPNALALARKYAQADEEQLLTWLEAKSPELAEYMRALRSIPEEEQQYILDAMLNDIKAIHSGQAVYTKVSADE
jgi:hypothetical protein